MIKVDSLTKRFANVLAVDSLTFEIAPGEVFGFVGSNGAGKSTTIKIIVGLLQPSSGTVYINGRNIADKKSNFKETIGYMPDFFGVYDDLKVKEYMNFYCGLHGIATGERPAVIEQMLELVKLEQSGEQYVDQLSRGMKQRLCLARALIHDPEILVLDEPASGLDPRARVEFRNILRTLIERDKTILISSHILSELAEICTSIGIIDAGKMVVKGSVGEIQRKMSTLSRITLKTTNDIEFARQQLTAQPQVSNISKINDGLQFSYSGDQASKARLLHQLITAGLAIYHFEEEDGNLESIFMQLTEEVAHD